MNISVDDLEPYAVSLTQKLIRFPTENPPGRMYYECARFLKSECETLGLESELVHVEHSDRYSVLAWTGSSRTDLHFHCHYDVVPAGPGWTVDPFGGDIANGLIYGRGSSDMKGAIASVFTALKALGSSHKSVSVSITPDEETGGKLGAEYIVKNELINTRMAVLPEPTGVETIFNACKGALWFEITCHGQAGHPSMKGHGLNAFEKMITTASKLQALKKTIESRKSSHPSYPEEGVWANLNMGGRCSTGEAVNAVPGRAVFTIDRRTLPEEDMEEAKKEIIECIQDTEDAEYRILLESSPFYVDETAEVCRLLKNASEEVTGQRVDFALCPGFLDARHFVAAGIPCITWGPGIYENAHISNEYIRIQDIMTAAKVFYVMISR